MCLRIIFNSLVNILKKLVKLFFLMSHIFLFLALTNRSFSFPFSRLTLNVIYPTLKRQPQISRKNFSKFFCKNIFFDYYFFEYFAYWVNHQVCSRGGRSRMNKSLLIGQFRLDCGGGPTRWGITTL